MQHNAMHYTRTIQIKYTYKTDTITIQMPHKYNTIQYNTIQYHTVQSNHNTTQLLIQYKYNTIQLQSNTITIQYNTIQI